MRRLAIPIGWLVFAAFGAGLVAQPDPREAAEQFRVARRLAADGSPQALAAYARVVELDPEGELADDALMEQARLLGAASWPEELGSGEASRLTTVRAILDRTVGEYARGDRILEVRFHRALNLLEPRPGYDATEASRELIAVATARPTDRWSVRARYALAWLNEQRGLEASALAGYQRLVVEHPQDEAAARARVGKARMLLRDARHGEAARWLQEAIVAGVPEETGAVALRELAVRGLLDPSAGSGAPAFVGKVEVRGFAGMAVTPSGGLLVGARKDNRVSELTSAGRVIRTWPVEAVEALALDPGGHAFAAAAGVLYRLEPSSAVVRHAAYSGLAPLASLAVDHAGRGYLLERRGQRVFRVLPGSETAELLWEDRERRLISMVWDGRHLVAVDARTRGLVAIETDGSFRELVGQVLERPVSVAVDPAGQLAVLDERGGTVGMFRGNGTSLRFWEPDPEQGVRATAIGLGADGSLHLFDAGAGVWWKRP